MKYTYHTNLERKHGFDCYIVVLVCDGIIVDSSYFLSPEACNIWVQQAHRKHQRGVQNEQEQAYIN